MSEDHNLSLPRERLRIMSKTLPPWSTLPIESFEPYLPLQMRSGLLQSNTADAVSIFEVGALVARRANPYSNLAPSLKAGGGSSSTANSTASSDGGAANSEIDASGHGKARTTLGSAPKWDSSLHLSAILERENELESELMRRSNSDEFIFGADALDGSNTGRGVQAEHTLEATFHKNSPKVTARKSVFARSAEKTSGTVAVDDGKSGSSFVNSGSANLVGAMGIGNSVLTQHARAVSRQYIETAAARQVLASKFIKKVRGLMNRFGTKSAGWNGNTTKVREREGFTRLSSFWRVYQSSFPLAAPAPP